jgi:hypothetical protein
MREEEEELGTRGIDCSNKPVDNNIFGSYMDKNSIQNNQQKYTKIQNNDCYLNRKD